MIDTEEKLGAFVPNLRAATWVAVDTEADSLHAYPEKVCLIQISTAAGDVLVDPLAGFNLNPVLEALGGHQLIMHGADYDLRLLEKHHRFTPGRSSTRCWPRGCSVNDSSVTAISSKNIWARNWRRDRRKPTGRCVR